jgi:pheromone a factor receptor
MASLSARDFLGKGDVIIIRPFDVPDPITYPTLIFNLVLRTTMGFLAIFACLVPLRLLYRNKEFAAIVFVVNDLGLCLINTINALIWHDDNMDDWYTGFGWCDLHPYLYVPMMTLFTTSVLAHSRGMAEKVSLVRASPMTKRERRRNYLMQSLIMFPLPIVQLAWMYPLTAQRFVLTTLVGCDWRVDGSWPWLTFFILPIPILSIIAGIYACKFPLAPLP